MEKVESGSLCGDMAYQGQDGPQDLFREASSTEASPSLGSGQITKGLTESQRPVPDIMSQRRSPRVKRNAADTSLFNVVKVCRLHGLPYLR